MEAGAGSRTGGSSGWRRRALLLPLILVVVTVTAAGFSSESAAPTGRASAGESGTLVGPEHWGEQFLAGPLAPFLRTAGVVSLLALALIPIGVFLFRRVKAPLPTELEARERWEEELEGFFAYTVDLVGIFNHDGTFRRINPSWGKVLGYSDDEIVGRSFMDFVHPDDVEATARVRAAQVDEGKTVFKFENRYRHRDGSYRWLNWTSHPDPESGLTFAIARDVTSAKEQADELEEDRARLEERVAERTEDLTAARARAQHYLDVSAVTLLSLDLDGRISMVNRAGLRILGYDSEEELLGKNWFDTCLPERLRPEVGTVFADSLGEEDDSWRYHENVVLTRAGQERLMAWHNSLVRDESGEVVGTLASGIDITKEREAEQALQFSEQRFRDLVETSQDLIWQCDEEGILVYLNPAWEQSHGFPLEEMLARPLAELAEVGSRDQDEGMMRAVLEGKSVRGHETCHRSRGGKTVHLRINALSLRDSEGSLVGAQGTAYNVTDQVMAEEAHRASEERFRTTFEQAAVGLAHTSPDGRFLRANRQLGKITGYPREDLLGMTWEALAHSEDLDMIRESIGSLRGGERRAAYVECRCVQRDGNTVWISITATLARGVDGEMTYGIDVVEDITDRKRAEDELRESRERLRGLAARLEEVREEERTGIARELHDELGQALTALRMDLAFMEEGLPDEETELADRVRSMVELTDTTINAVQTMSARLRSPVLDVLGLQAAVEWQVEEFAGRTEIACEVEMPDEGLDLVEKRATGVFRILQEALTNVARHAEASRVRVCLEEADGQLVLEVEDDGVGVSEEVLESYESLGLIGMRERAEAMEGEVKIERRPEGGTRVVLRVGQTEGAREAPKG